MSISSDFYSSLSEVIKEAFETHLINLTAEEKKKAE